MMRGIRFEVNDASAIFLSLRELIDVTMYDWYIDDVELNYFNCLSGKLYGSEFQSKLYDLTTLSFVRVRRYPVGANIYDIDTYEDYLESSCDMLMLFYDGGFCEIYEKNLEILLKTLKLCIDRKFDNVACMKDDNNERCYMHF